MNILGKVTWELSAGVRAMRTLSEMLSAVGNACGLSVQIDGDRDHMGVHLDGQNFWVGINYDWPEILQFSTEARKVDAQAAELLGLEGVFAWKDHSGHGWTRSLKLECEDVHFFARTKASQMQVLTRFVRECLDTVSRIELRPEAATTTIGAS